MGLPPTVHRPGVLPGGQSGGDAKFPHEGTLSNGREASNEPRSQSQECLTALPLSACQDHNRIEGWYNEYPADPKKRPLSPQSNKTELKSLVHKNTYALSAALMAAGIVWAAHAAPQLGATDKGLLVDAPARGGDCRLWSGRPRKSLRLEGR